MQFYKFVLSVVKLLDEQFWTNELAAPQLAAMFVAGSLEIASQDVHQVD